VRLQLLEDEAGLVGTPVALLRGERNPSHRLGQGPQVVGQDEGDHGADAPYRPHHPPPHHGQAVHPRQTPLARHGPDPLELEEGQALYLELPLRGPGGQVVQAARGQVRRSRPGK